MSFTLYLLGFLIMLGGLIYGAHLMHEPERWIVVGDVVLGGDGILSAVTETRHKDTSA